MNTYDLWITKSDCCGCELCSCSCPKSVIKMKTDEEGFQYPFIDNNSNCINCKKCLTVCPMKKAGRDPVVIEKSFCFSMPENDDLRKSASGGLATAISRAFINQGGVVYGVSYSDNFLKIKYARAVCIGDLELFRGSKYAQADKGNLYGSVKKDLEAGLKVLVIGLPCEISAIYHAIPKREKLYTISLICHGPTSQKVHCDFCANLPNANQSKLKSFSVRYKNTGWKPYYIFAQYEDGTVHKEVWNKSDYGIAFQYLKRPSCRVCRYKAEDIEYGLQSDMTIGDFHGAQKNSKYYNPWGVSQGSIQTEKGYFLTSLIEEETMLLEIPYSVIKGTNVGLFKPIPQRGKKDVFLNDYLNHSLHYACNSWMVKRTECIINLRYRSIVLRAIRKIKKYVRI